VVVWQWPEHRVLWGKQLRQGDLEEYQAACWEADTKLSASPGDITRSPFLFPLWSTRDSR